MDSPRRIQLIAPAERGSVRLARILAAGVAADAGLSIDDTEDLRIAVSELVALLVDGLDDPDLSIEVDFSRDPAKSWSRATARRWRAGPTSPTSTTSLSRSSGSSSTTTPSTLAPPAGASVS